MWCSGVDFIQKLAQSLGIIPWTKAASTSFGSSRERFCKAPSGRACHRPASVLGLDSSPARYSAVHSEGPLRRKKDPLALSSKGGNFHVFRGAITLGPRGVLAALGLLVAAFACEPRLVVGEWRGGDNAGSGGNAGTGGESGSSGSSGTGGTGGDSGGSGGSGSGGTAGGGTAASNCGAADGAGGEGGAPNVDGLANPVELDWSSSFEDGTCDYTKLGGFCYAQRRASYEFVSSPVHSGKSAAAFSLVTDSSFNESQSRCVRQGALPEAAYYSAYFFIPSAPTAANNWNLIHFRGVDASGSHGLWDISLAPQGDGTLRVYVFDQLRQLTRMPTGVTRVPVGEWFELGAYLVRAPNATGQFTVYVNGEVAVSLKNLSTDDTKLGQWYVGSLAISLTPPDSTIYVDDVSIREMP